MIKPGYYNASIPNVAGIAKHQTQLCKAAIVG
jgi:hypothetical protein